jgi:hypothetical protein
MHDRLFALSPSSATISRDIDASRISNAAGTPAGVEQKIIARRCAVEVESFFEKYARRARIFAGPEFAIFNFQFAIRFLQRPVELA